MSDEAAESTSRATKSWEIVGVAVTAFTVVSAILLLSVFFGFMHQLGWTGYVEPVTQVMTFGMVNGAVKLLYRFRARVDGE